MGLTICCYENPLWWDEEAVDFSIEIRTTTLDGLPSEMILASVDGNLTRIARNYLPRGVFTVFDLPFEVELVANEMYAFVLNPGPDFFGFIGWYGNNHGVGSVYPGGIPWYYQSDTGIWVGPTFGPDSADFRFILGTDIMGANIVPAVLPVFNTLALFCLGLICLSVRIDRAVFENNRGE